MRSRTLRAAAAGLAAGAVLPLTAVHAAPTADAQPTGAASRCGTHAWCDPSLSPDRRAAMVVEALTFDEEVSLLAGDDLATSGLLGDTPLSAYSADGQSHTGTSRGVERVGVPRTYYSDGPQGVRQGQATALPIPLGLAATFSPALARRYAAVIGNEARLKGNDVVYGPTVNIARVPMNSRTFESYGEDPALSGGIGVGFVRGLRSQGIAANVKHFAAYNQEGTPEGNRLVYDARVSERALREIYLAQFEQVVKQARPASIMCSYNRLNGQGACENQWLLNDVLRGDWGFRGFVLSDYIAAKNTVASLNNGLDFEPFPGVAYSAEAVKAAHAAGQVSTATLERHVHNILRGMFAEGFFDRADHAFRPEEIDVRAHARISGEIEDAAITLLKNTGVLPLSARRLRSVAVIGPGATQVPTGGGSASVTPYSMITPLEGIRARVGDRAQVRHDDGSDVERAAQVARGADVAVVVTRTTTTGSLFDDCLRLQCSDDEVDQDELVRAVASANPRTVVVLQTPSAVLTPWRGQVEALVEAWHGGAQAGRSLAEVLFGDVNPSGNLPLTFPAGLDQLPTAGSPEQYPGTAQTVEYREGVLVGYRWYDERGLRPAYPFGHGLSYTTFGYDRLRLRALPGRRLDVTVRVTNTGRRAGATVAQLYLGLPEQRGQVQPPRQLRAYERVSLRPGAATVIRFRLPARAFATWQAGGWRVPPGCFRIEVGESSRDIRARGAVRTPGTRCAGTLLRP